jgi:hypothetical protein
MARDGVAAVRVAAYTSIMGIVGPLSERPKAGYSDAVSSNPAANLSGGDCPPRPTFYMPSSAPRWPSRSCPRGVSGRGGRNYALVSRRVVPRDELGRGQHEGDRPGSVRLADVLKPEDIEKPAVGKGQVILRVGAASVFIGDWHMMTGTPYAIRN